MMVKELNKKGFNLKRRAPIVQVADLFYNNIVRKADKSFEEIDYEMNFRGDDHAAGVAIKAIVDGIISFVKGIKKKKEDGKEKLSKVEESIAVATIQTEKRLKAKAKEETAKEVGKKLLFDKKTQYLIAGAVVMIIVIAVIVVRKTK